MGFDSTAARRALSLLDLLRLLRTRPLDCALLVESRERDHNILHNPGLLNPSENFLKL